MPLKYFREVRKKCRNRGDEILIDLRFTGSMCRSMCSPGHVRKSLLPLRTFFNLGAVIGCFVDQRANANGFDLYELIW